MSILAKHLAVVKASYRLDKVKIDQLNQTMRQNDLEYNPSLAKEFGNAEGLKMKISGNYFFERGEYDKARHFYTQCLASVIDGPLAAQSYGNRSAALFHMKLYKDCMKDIDRALRSGFPENLRWKLFLRKARCLKYLGQDHEPALQEAIQVIENSDFPLEMKKQLVEAAKPEVDKDEPSYENKLPEPHLWALPDLSYGVNSEVPSFSNAVSLQYNKDIGRHLVANQAIQTGDVLVVDKCVVASLAGEVRWDFCSRCFRSSMALVPCSKCGCVMYCGEECRDVDWSSGHEYACYFTKCCYDYGSMNNAFDSLDLGRTTVEIGSGKIFNCNLQKLIGFLGLENIRNAVKEDKALVSFSDKRTEGFVDGKLETLNLESILSMKDNLDKIDSQEKRSFATAALNLAGLHKIPDEEMFSVSALFFKLFLILKCNFKPIYYFKTDYTKVGLPRVVVGSGLHLPSNIIRHACDANMIQIGYGSSFVYRARRPIAKGEQLTDCFLTSASNFELPQRQMMLRVANFVCNCEACVQNWPVLSMLPGPKMDAVEILLMRQAGINFSNKVEIKKLVYFLQFGIASDCLLLPKLMALLKGFHESNSKRMTKWYFMMQESIKNHFRAKGNNFFYGDSKDIFEGKKKFVYNEEQLKKTCGNIQQAPSSF
ncbi:SET and MYND domain-containing protein 4-like isoform X2 [Neocloeon triangulifer]|nr:SET and MYND domain-containing protein 4-like isoform X2 [Neocloeon triangulifer]